MSRLLVCGTRDAPINDTSLCGFILSITGNDPSLVIVHGGSGNVDLAAGRVAKDIGIPVEVFEADWDGWRAKGNAKAAGPMRNQQMAEVADMALAIWDGRSRGTLDAISRCIKQGISVTVIPPSYLERSADHFKTVVESAARLAAGWIDAGNAATPASED